MPGAPAREERAVTPEPFKTETKKTDWTPEPKTAMTGIGGALAVVLLWVAGLAGIEMQVADAVALATLVIFLVSYRTPPGPRRGE
jgi:hypothetical protein